MSQLDHDTQQPIISGDDESEPVIKSAPAEKIYASVTEPQLDDTQTATVPLIHDDWSSSDPVTDARPVQLPEPTNPEQPLPPYQPDIDQTIFLPSLPTPHTDILWADVESFPIEPTPIEPVIDFLADEKLRLLRKHAADSAIDEDAQEATRWKTFKAVVKEIGETILLTVIIFFLIQAFIRNFRVVGTSMVNNLHDGQYLIIDKVMYNPLITEVIGIGGIQRGDVIVFEPPNRPEDDYVKRVIGLPGETVEIIQGQVYINNELLDETFKPRTGSYSMAPVTVEPEHIFVLGDNRNNSNDSHNWGTLPIRNIVGRAWLSYWPPSDWGYIPRDIPSEQATLKTILGDIVPSANAADSEPSEN
ncbi:signal peptidase I [Anaerolineales bacterium HSG6]|nr:signal peptidase I [Anaerolineales bacterium HSG6]